MTINPAYLSGVGLYSWDQKRMKMAPKIAKTTNTSATDPFFPTPYSEGEIIFRRMNSSTVQVYCAIADGEGTLYWMPVAMSGPGGRTNADTGTSWTPYPTFPLTNNIRAR